MPFRPKFAADYRTMLWTFVFTPGLIAVQYARPDLVKYLCWLSIYFAVACGVIAHNHNHRPTFGKRWENSFFASWISIMYGFPVFAWVPTHNLNHHKYVNTPGDATITWRFTNSHNALVAATYFFVSAYYQSGPTKQYILKAKETNPSLYRRIITQYVVTFGSHALMLVLALGLYGVKTGLYTYFFAMGLPAFISLWTLMLFNYDQHVHTDPWSEHDHSRSFVGPIVNFLLFNNGYHAAHHEKASAHWSTLREEHAKLAPLINPVLQQKNLLVYWFKQYLLALFVPSVGSVQLGRGPWNLPDGKRASLETADVDAEDSGSNADRIRVPA
jgi:beta-carotene hydroxylase